VQIVPDITDNRLPALGRGALSIAGVATLPSAKFLYKLIFDLKNDLNDLKQFVFDVLPKAR
jgi:hypothetical protein